MKIEVLDNYLNDSIEPYNKDAALKKCGKIASICYSKTGLAKAKKEDSEKTLNRINLTLDSGHHSIYDHEQVQLYIEDIPKILAMVLNNEKMYTTSEKSERYVKASRDDSLELKLYFKWVEILKEEITKKYGKNFDSRKIEKLALENARYFISVFTPKTMVYTTSLRQINQIATMMEEFINKDDKTPFEEKLATAMQEFILQLDWLGVLDTRLMQNNKNRKLSLFMEEPGEEYFGDVYSTNYEASLACLAQAQRHRTLDYKMKFTEGLKFYMPIIVADNDELRRQWDKDFRLVKHDYPQGQCVLITERGFYENFVLKAYERLCTDAQLEVMLRTKDTLNKYYKALDDKNPLKSEMENYTHGARCTFPGFKCSSDCHYLPGKRLIRKI